MTAIQFIKDHPFFCLAVVAILAWLLLALRGLAKQSRDNKDLQKKVDDLSKPINWRKVVNEDRKKRGI